MSFRILLLGLCTALITGCGGPMAGPDAPTLTERVWDVHAGRFITPSEAADIVARADYALLGESHDNARHHEIQRQLLARAVESGTRAIAFEQLDRERQASVDAALANAPTVESVMAAGHVAQSWKPALYVPLFDFAIANGLRIVAANYSRERSRALVAGGLSVVDAQEAERLALTRTWTPQRQARERALIVEGHCGQDDPLVDKLVDIQRMRDAVMADAILQEPRVVAIIGRGHARADVGVPLYLHARAPDRRVISVGLVEIEAGNARPADYPDAAPGIHDLVWFTVHADRGDPCAGFK